jgi:signal transduction histidine kinase
MQPGQHPDAVDTRLVLRIYAWVVTAIGLAFLMRSLGGVVAAFGFTAVGLARIEDPISRVRALKWFAIGHLVFGGIFFIQSYTVFDEVVPSVLGWTPLVIGIVLLYIALTCAHVPRFSHPFRGLFDGGPVLGPVILDRPGYGTSMGTLRSQYEHQIRQAARMEERSRLARDLHDAVKQQLFAIQTSAATAQERVGEDNTGAHVAISQVRESARDATKEMEALITQLHAAPLENTGLVAALTQQCEALELRTGATVQLETGTLPPSGRLPPGAQHALFRGAQEALANIARHARATHVKVRLGMSGDNLELVIRDDGAGFDQMAPSPGMGIKNMLERVGEVSGSMLVHSLPGRGTTVAFSIPCDTRTSRDYAIKAVVWAGVLALMMLNASFGDNWERPWSTLVAAVAAVTSARFLAAWYRVHSSDHMTTLSIVPKRWYSWDFNVFDGSRQVALVDVSTWREKGTLVVDGAEYRVSREGIMSGDFTLERHGSVLARATKPSAFRHTFIIKYDGREYVLRKKSIWRRAFVLLRNEDTEVGGVSPNSIWTRDATVSLPDEWPLAIKVFVMWLAIILWKRDADSTVAASA